MTSHADAALGLALVRSPRSPPVVATRRLQPMRGLDRSPLAVVGTTAMMALAAIARALDRVRSPLVAGVLGRCAALRAVARQRDRRLALGGVAAVLAALALALAAPAAAFLWAPLVLGIPHVLADARYLVASPYRRIALGRRDLGLAAGLLALAVVGAPWLGAAIVAGAVALAPPGRRRAAVLAAALALVAVAWRSPVIASYAVLHAHNVIALVVLAALAGRRAWIVIAGAVAITAMVLAGALDALLPGPALAALAGYVLPEAALATWSPGLCARIALTFVFLQGVHYAVWLRLLPAVLRPHGGMRGFGASLRALERDVGATVVAVAAAAALVLPALAVTGACAPEALRALYIQLAGGHAYLELAVLARWLAR